MHHPAELSLHSYLRGAVDGKSTMSQEVIDQVAEDIKVALHKQFNPEEEEPRKFKLRMSNIGRPTCQLWFQKNDPNDAEPKPTSFKINMIMGDIVEAVFKGLLRASGTTFDDNDRVTLDLPKGGKDIGGWWVVNKANGNFKYVSAEEANSKEVLEKIEDTYEYIDKDEPFERCFDAVPETYRKKPSGNMKLGSGCRFCDHRFKCWPTLQALPSRVSQAKDKPIVEYVSVTEAA